MHDGIAGVEAMARKEDVHKFIEDQLELGEEGLDERNHYLLELNLEDLETTTGEEQHYSLLQIQATRMEISLGRISSARRSRQPQGRERAYIFISTKYHSCIAGTWTFNSPSLPGSDPGRREPALPCGP